MSITELDKLWADFTGLPVQPWESDFAKLDLSILTNDKDRSDFANEISGQISEEFYKRPTEKQDPYIFYFMVMSAKNSDTMKTILKLKGKLV